MNIINNLQDSRAINVQDFFKNNPAGQNKITNADGVAEQINNFKNNAARGVPTELDAGELRISMRSATQYFGSTGNLLSSVDYSNFCISEFGCLISIAADLIQKDENGAQRNLKDMASLIEGKLDAIESADFSEERRAIERQIWEGAFAHQFRHSLISDAFAANAFDNLEYARDFAEDVVRNIADSGLSKRVQGLMMKGLDELMSMEGRSLFDPSVEFEKAMFSVIRFIDKTRAPESSWQELFEFKKTALTVDFKNRGMLTSEDVRLRFKRNVSDFMGELVEMLSQSRE